MSLSTLTEFGVKQLFTFTSFYIWVQRFSSGEGTVQWLDPQISQSMCQIAYGLNTEHCFLFDAFLCECVYDREKAVFSL